MEKISYEEAVGKIADGAIELTLAALDARKGGVAKTLGALSLLDTSVAYVEAGARTIAALFGVSVERAESDMTLKVEKAVAEHFGAEE